jgi:hypothetical protein
MKISTDLYSPSDLLKADFSLVLPLRLIPAVYREIAYNTEKHLIF